VWSCDRGTAYTINTAGAAILEGRLVLRTNGIFIPDEVAKRFRDAFEGLSGAYVEQSMQFRSGRGAGYEKSMEVLDTTGKGEIADLETLLRATIRRAQFPSPQKAAQRRNTCTQVES
jgi:hypothetical protein